MDVEKRRIKRSCDREAARPDCRGSTDTDGAAAGGRKEIEMKKLEEYVRSIPDFPEPGIIFRDVTSIL